MVSAQKNVPPAVQDFRYRRQVILRAKCWGLHAHPNLRVGVIACGVSVGWGEHANPNINKSINPLSTWCDGAAVSGPILR